MTEGDKLGPHNQDDPVSSVPASGPCRRISGTHPIADPVITHKDQPHTAVTGPGVYSITNQTEILEVSPIRKLLTYIKKTISTEVAHEAEIAKSSATSIAITDLESLSITYLQLDIIIGAIRRIASICIDALRIYPHITSHEHASPHYKRIAEIQGNIVHNINNKLTAALGSTELMVGSFIELTDPENAGLIIQAMNEIVDLINTMNKYSESEESATQISINDLIETVTRYNKKQTFNLELGNVEIRARYEHIQCLLENVIGNAVKFTNNPEIPVEISLTAEGSNAVIVVKNEGQKLKQPEKVFDYGYREAAETIFPGTGIGLHTCKGICNKYSGSIVPTNNNNGVTITITLPLE